MCGRYSLALGDPAGLRGRFPLGEQVAIRRRFNVAPGDDVLAVTTTREGAPRGELLRWGLVPPWGPPAGRTAGATGLKMINARAETLTERPAYREAFRRFRCLIIADGFYEWRAVPGTGKQPFHIARADRAPFAFAGLWSRWRSADTEVRSCSIITTAAEGEIAAIHDRMPVILPVEAEARWLEPTSSPDALAELVRGLPSSELTLTPVGPAVSDARYDGPACLEPARADWAPAEQLSLLD